MNDPRPAFMFNVVEFWSSAKVDGMDAEAVGIYLFLLSRQWQNGSIPADERAVQRMCRKLAPRDWPATWEVIERCFPVDADGERRNSRLERERELADEQSAAQSGKAKKRWERWRSQQAEKEATAQPTNAAALPVQSRGSPAAMPHSRSAMPPTGTGQGQDNRTPGDLRSPAPLAGGSALSDLKSKPARKKPADPWEAVLARPEFDAVRASPPLLAAFDEWRDHCATAGSKATSPVGPQAVMLLREAREAGAELYALAVRLAIAGNWRKPHVDAAREELASARVGAAVGPRPISKTEAATTAEIVRSRAVRAEAGDEAEPRGGGLQFDEPIRLPAGDTRGAA